MKLAVSTPFPPTETALLGLEPSNPTPVQIILAAQLRLRRFRQGRSLGVAMPTGDEVRQIVAARDSLLRLAVGSIACRGRRPPGG